MNRTPVNSSRINSVGYSEGILEVEFNNGTVYQYAPVLESTYTELLASKTIGKDIQAVINDKSVTCTKISV